jgi:hypothetical protein
METISTNDRHKDRISSQTIAGLGMAVLVVVTLLAAGCRKAKPPAVQAADEQNTNPAAPAQVPVSQQPAPASPVAVAAQPAAGPDLRELDRGLIRWIVSNRRRPGNFEEFAATANITIPPPPAGKKYVFDHTMHIQLVDR